MANSLSSALEVAMRTDPGLVRGDNEDSILVDLTHGFAILADGMGGYDAGEVASKMATTLLANRLLATFANTPAHSANGHAAQSSLRRLIGGEIAVVNSAIHDAAEQQTPFHEMGTTLVVAVFCDDHLVAAHVGDSRLYRLRGRKLKALTRDHSLLQEQIDSGLVSPAEARYAVNRNLVTRALGIEPAVEPEVHVYKVRPGDIYLLCSDGLHDMVTDQEIQYLLEEFRLYPDRMVAELVDLANSHGGEDNISVIVIKILHQFPVAPRGWLKLRSWFS
ncbi:MAG TPA: protein phosphatase 2C domain-containing protein [Accumulibacter sp.]|nr:protein phosphatase 2C domain-containing protein [Accumulibacter sp.]HQC80448.1 protein phosphatase 2C domain-containing protein [Accumulibacter sp.]